ncbi:putative PEP-binding protein [Nocardia sp. NPDC052112]|uniref:putative PEP-binding protein n=1 Tax=Nocardia sp. NPDC052112 TaxID=3155646 RepID=UPI00344AC57A
MRQSLALSCERISAELLDHFDGVGMVRGEYVFRAAGKYPTPESVSGYLVPYLRHIAKRASGTTIWYRTMEADTAECNTLDGVEEIIDEPHKLLGLRGIRRARRYPGAFIAELEGIAQVRDEGADIGVLFPFVTYVDELQWAIEQTRAVIGDCPVATMIEIPSLLLEVDRVVTTGVSRVVIGCNDLSSLLLGQARATLRPVRPVPPLLRAIERVTMVAAAAGVRTAVAGYLHPDLLAACANLGVDECVLHYSDLPEVLGEQFADLPDLDVLQAIKRKTRAAIAVFEAERAAGSDPDHPHAHQTLTP